jgi:hypothetical protein
MHPNTEGCVIEQCPIAPTSDLHWARWLLELGGDLELVTTDSLQILYSLRRSTAQAAPTKQRVFVEE